MSFSLAEILLYIIAYLGGLFTVAHLADRDIIPQRISRHPAVYVLSLGVFAGATATNGVFALASAGSSNFLMYYLGVVLMFIFTPILLLPLLRLCRVYQLASLADVLTFRFRSQAVGASVTIAMCLTLLPLLAMQIQAVADSIHILAGNEGNLLAGVDRQDGLALLFCGIITLFSLLFGTRDIVARHRNTGLVTAIAFESLVKLAALIVLMIIVVWQVFDGLDGLDQWLVSNLAEPTALAPQTANTESRVLLLLFFAGAVGMPHMFHMVFAENTDSQNLRIASWGLPLYLCLLSLPVLPITWAGIKLGHQLPQEYTGLAIGLALQSTSVAAIAFVASLSASSAAIIVVTLALANMCLHHLVLPGQVLQFDRQQSIYRQLKWLRRALITAFIMAGYCFFIVLEGSQSLSQLALTAFTGTLQFFPGIVATPYWQGANRIGLLSGLAAGLGCWFLWVVLPAITDLPPSGLHALTPEWLVGQASWPAAALLSLAVNTAIFIGASLLTRATDEEQIAAEICSMDDFKPPVRHTLAQQSADEFIEQLSTALGEATARAEVNRAMRQLQFYPDESRPYALRRVRNRIESNLASLLGPAVAHSIVNRCLPFQRSLQESNEDINLIERNLDRAQLQFTGRAAELDNLRRHYRETLDNLPIGVCSSATDGELTMWNRCMEQITGISAQKVLGSHMSSLPKPWSDIINDFLDGEVDTVLKKEVNRAPPGDHPVPAGKRWISLHKAGPETRSSTSNDRVILIEDITDYELMEGELIHSERLASIGRLAAGVAHEIGNPVTGIACLAQNLEYETEPEEIRNTALDILKQTDRVTRIVQSLVNFSHTGSAAGDIALVPCNLADCIDEAIHLLQLDLLAKEIRFENDCDREIVVSADSQRLLQVFINLLTNARDACFDNGRVQVRARGLDDWVEIEIEDNGCGIAPELHNRIFEPFHTSKDPGAGTGLGLALVYNIMEDMGGSIQVQSPVNAGENPGTRFCLRLRQGDYGSSFDL